MVVRQLGWIFPDHSLQGRGMLSAMSTDTDKRERLRAFLEESFSPEELEAFLILEGKSEVVRRLNRNVDTSRYVSHVVQELDQRGLVDAGFFDHLTRQLPTHDVEIQRLKGFWLESRIIVQYEGARPVPQDVFDRIQADQRFEVLVRDHRMMLVKGSIEQLRSVISESSDPDRWLLTPEVTFTVPTPAPSVQQRRSERTRLHDLKWLGTAAALLHNPKWLGASAALLLFSAGLVVFLYLPGAHHRNAWIATKDPFGETVRRVVYLNQNWSPQESTEYYFTSVGSRILPYNWFLHLEQPDNNRLFRDETNVLALRYLAQKPGPMNPDGLPVGFVKDEAESRPWLGLTCAACHTGEIHYKGVAYRIDGGPGLGDFAGLLRSLKAALLDTLAQSEKFDRFARNVIKGHNSDSEREFLKREMATTILQCGGYIRGTSRPAISRSTAESTPSAQRSTKFTTTPLPRGTGPPPRPIRARPMLRRASLSSGIRPSTTCSSGTVVLGTRGQETWVLWHATSARCSASSSNSKSLKTQVRPGTHRRSGSTASQPWKTGSRRFGHPSGPRSSLS